MKNIYIAGGGRKNTAIMVLTQHLKGLGHYVTRDAQDPRGWGVTLRWGTSYRGDKPAINAGVNKYNKYQAMLVMARHGVNVPIVFSVFDAPDVGRGQKFPWLARKFNHKKGLDIVKVNNLQEAKAATLNGSDFFSVFVPSTTEYRVWVLNGKVLAVYEKCLKPGVEWDGVARNHRFGFSFTQRDEMTTNRELTFQSVEAVKALGMDFGAVDVLLGHDKKFYVLEVNSMPNIDGPARLSGIRLAKAVSQWAEKQ